MCVLRVSGEQLDGKTARLLLTAAPVAHFRRGEPTPDGKLIFPETALTWVVADLSVRRELAFQQAEAERFLQAEQEGLRALLRLPGVSRAFLDFYAEAEDLPVESFHFPAALLGALGSLGLGMEVTRYERGAFG